MNTVYGYKNYLGAIVVNDCPVCGKSHFLKVGGLERYAPQNKYGDGVYVCFGENVGVRIEI